MVWKFLKDLFARPVRTDVLDEVRPGQAVLTGTVRCERDLIHSPIQGTACAAFYYRATWAAPARGNTVRRLLQQAEVYAPRFELLLEGGSVPVVASSSDVFGAAEHLELRGGGLPGFEAAEQLIRPGDRVRISGRVRATDEGQVLEPRFVEILEAAPVTVLPAGENRAARRTARKRERREGKADRG